MSFRPSPVMSARRTRWDGSSKNTSGNSSESWLRAIDRGGGSPARPTSEPQELVVARHQGVGSAVAGQIDHPDGRVLRIEPGGRLERGEPLPGTIERRFEETGERADVDEQVRNAVARHVAEADALVVERDAGRRLRQRPRPIQRAVAEVAPVAEPALGRLQNIGQPVAEEVDQRHAGGVQGPRREVAAHGGERLVALLNGLEARVGTDDRGHAGRSVLAIGIAVVAGDRRRGEQRGLGVRVRVVREVGGADQRRTAQLGEVMEHQHATAATEGSDLEPARRSEQISTQWHRDSSPTSAGRPEELKSSSAGRFGMRQRPSSAGQSP